MLPMHVCIWFACLSQLECVFVSGRNKANYTRDPFVKLFLLPDERTCRISKMKKKTLSPIFNETFDFQVSFSC